MREVRYYLSKLLYKTYDVINPTIEISEPFIDWVTFVNGGWLNKGNTYSFDYAIRNLPTNDPILEIGSFAGLSTNVICYLLKKYKKQNTFFNTDPWIWESQEEDGILHNSTISNKHYRQHVIESYKKNINFFSSENLPHTFELTSEFFFQQWEKKNMSNDIFNREVALGGRFSFCYIDGNHLYEYVKKDFLLCDKFLVKDGFILFDDSYRDFHPGVWRLIKEIKKNKDYKCVINNPNYLFKKVK